MADGDDGRGRDMAQAVAIGAAIAIPVPFSDPVSGMLAGPRHAFREAHHGAKPG